MEKIEKIIETGVLIGQTDDMTNKSRKNLDFYKIGKEVFALDRHFNEIVFKTDEKAALKIIDEATKEDLAYRILSRNFYIADEKTENIRVRARRRMLTEEELPSVGSAILKSFSKFLDDRDIAY